jgi:hypothetical protein
MKTSPERPKKSPASKPRPAGLARRARQNPAARKVSTALSLCSEAGTMSRQARAQARREVREFVASLPTALERDTLLMPEVIAETVVQEAERFLQADLPADYAERLAAKAYYLYGRHKHFHQTLNGRGNCGRDSLYMYMRHWTGGWLKRECNPLSQKLPWEYALGHKLYGLADDGKKLVEGNA